MNILVIGATGRTGKEVIGQGCARGHRMTALVRQPRRLTDRQGLTKLVGNPLDPETLRPLLAGSDAAISALGITRGGDQHLLERAAEAMLEALGGEGGVRYIAVSQGLLFPSRNPMVHLLRLALASRVADSRAMERRVAASGANWTIVRPPRLTDASRKRGYKALQGARPPGFSMSRADLAAYLLDEAEAGTNLRSIVGVS